MILGGYSFFQGSLKKLVSFGYNVWPRSRLMENLLTRPIEPKAIQI